MNGLKNLNSSCPNPCTNGNGGGSSGCGDGGDGGAGGDGSGPLDLHIIEECLDATNLLADLGCAIQKLVATVLSGCLTDLTQPDVDGILAEVGSLVDNILGSDVLGLLGGPGPTDVVPDPAGEVPDPTGEVPDPTGIIPDLPGIIPSIGL